MGNDIPRCSKGSALLLHLWQNTTPLGLKCVLKNLMDPAVSIYLYTILVSIFNQVFLLSVHSTLLRENASIFFFSRLSFIWYGKQSPQDLDLTLFPLTHTYRLRCVSSDNTQLFCSVVWPRPAGLVAVGEHKLPTQATQTLKSPSKGVTLKKAQMT